MSSLRAEIREERQRLRVECSMLHRAANQLQDMPDDRSKLKARQYRMEAELVAEILRRSK